MAVCNADGADHPPPAPPSREGGERFGKAAARLAGLAAQALGWRPAEFWAATPAELALSLGVPDPDAAPPTRSEILNLIERDQNARSD